MKSEELQHALEDLSGDEPAVDDALAGVTRKVRKQRTHTWTGVAAACALVVAVAAVGVERLRSDDGHRVTVVNPAASNGDVADFNWNRVPAPAMTINRIVTANGKTFAVGSTPDGQAAVGELDANGNVTKTVDPAFDPTDFGVNAPPPGTVNDLVGIPGALIAVGGSNGVNGSHYADAWRSTDDGDTWHGSAVETSADGPLRSIDRVVFSKGVVYAIGTPPDTTSTTHCLSNVWTSADGTDFHLLALPSNMECTGPEDAVDGPAGLLITTAGNAPPYANTIAWTKSGGTWTPHRIPTNATEPDAGIGALAADDHGYVAVGSFATASDSGAAIWWSPDGKAWKHVLTARAPFDPHGSWAVFTGVAHSPAGWIAVGAHGHGDSTSKESDAMVWTSPDGEQWTKNTRDGSDFEQFARANSVGVTADGFAILGLPNMTPEKLGISSDKDEALWVGSAANSSSGIVEGSMNEVGGLSHGPHGVPGSMVVAAADGHETTVPIDSNGRFSANLPPGSYHVVGHSPLYGSGKYDCTAPPDGRAVVRAGRVTHVALVCAIR